MKKDMKDIIINRVFFSEISLKLNPTKNQWSIYESKLSKAGL